ncbi:MAG: M23 family metallopeptidase [candidate division Zixibacteria bacterium]|nr:M23 family metallopeptidase [candidate division Zixibacteria bacterium]
MSFQLSGKIKITGVISFLGLVVVFSFFCSWSGLFERKTDENFSQISLSPSPLACIFQGELKKNEPLYLSLLRKGVSYRLIHQLTSALKAKFDLKKSLPGDCYTLVTTRDSVLFFEYQKGMREKCRVVREGGELRTTVEPLQFNCIVKSIQGEIKSSLWESMIELCQSPELIMKFTEVFEWEIDFLTEPRGGDTFRLIFEEYHRDGNFIKYGDILAAEYNLGNQIHQAVLYQNPEGRKGYFDPTGKSVRKAFLKSPLNYRRISSRFSYRRFHPIFKRFRPHLGVDYAAPVGTPVVASGDGLVTFTGWKRGFGKIVEIRHSNGFITSYGHLSRFARGIRKGKQVKQKDLIGYVGSTGVSTGPHLDYRVKANGRYVNPLRMVAPPIHPVKEEYLADFQRHQDNLLYALDLLTHQRLLVWSDENK